MCEGGRLVGSGIVHVNWAKEESHMSRFLLSWPSRVTISRIPCFVIESTCMFVCMNVRYIISVQLSTITRPGMCLIKRSSVVCYYDACKLDGSPIRLMNCMCANVDYGAPRRESMRYGFYMWAYM
jgi:hypothetical protein